MPVPESARKRFLETEGLPIIAVLLALVIVFMIAAPDVFLGYRIYMSFLATVPPVQALWSLAVAGVLWLVLNRHRFGEHLLFIGDNARVAEVVGVNVEREKIRAFMLMGVLAAFASVLLTFENRSFFNTQGGGYLLEVMAAVFIAGTAVFGGRASLVGTVAGSFIIGMVEAGLVATGLQGFWVRAVVGA